MIYGSFVTSSFTKFKILFSFKKGSGVQMQEERELPYNDWKSTSMPTMSIQSMRQVTTAIDIYAK